MSTRAARAFVGCVLVLALAGAAPPRPEATGAIAPGFRAVHVLRAGKEAVYGLDFSPDGKALAISSDDKLGLWCPRRGTLLRATRTPGPSSLSFLRGRPLLVGEEGTVDFVLIDRDTLRTKATVSTLPHTFSNLLPSPDGRFVVTVVNRRDVVLWDTDSGKEAGRFSYGAHLALSSLAVSVEGVVAATSGSAEVFLHDVRRKKSLGTLRLERPPGSPLLPPVAGTLAFSHDGRSLAIAVRGENVVWLWDLASRRPIREFRWGYQFDPKKELRPRPHLTPVGGGSLTFSPDNWTLALNSSDGGLHLFEVLTGGWRHGSPVAALFLAFSPDGSLLAAGNNPGKDVHVFDWRDPFSPDTRPGPLSLGRQASLWQELGSLSAEVGYRAVATLVARPREAASLLAHRLPRAEPVPPARLRALFAQLDDEDFMVRERATAALAELGEAVGPGLREFLAGRPSQEARTRVQELVRTLDTLGPERLRTVRGVEVLERLGNGESVRLLKRLAGGAEGAGRTDLARGALRRLRLRASSLE